MANKSKLRLRQVHYNTASYLSACLDRRSEWFSPFRSEVRRLSLHLNKLAKQAGISREGLTTSESYLEAIRALVRATGTDANAHASEIQKLTDEILSRRRQQERAATPPTEKQRLTTKVADDNSTYETLGIHAGDKLESEETTVEALCAGDLVAVWDKENDKWAGIGYFLATDEKDFHVQEHDGRPYHYTHGAGWWTLYLLNAITRRTEIKRGQSAEAERVKRELLITALKKRLDRLTSNDEESERFRVEREIYDLEHAAACAEDEWPEVVAA
jgi:DNA-binding phage protein